MKTLIVEDDFTSRIVLQTVLARYGECHIAVNGMEALKAFRRAMDTDSPYDLICMDILLPEMNGKDAVKEMRALEQVRGILSSDGVKIVMTTGVEDFMQIMDSFAKLCDAYLVKPVNTGELLQHVKAFGLIDNWNLPAATVWQGGSQR